MVGVSNTSRSVSDPASAPRQMVPQLWEEARDEHLMKGAVLVTITRLVQALGPEVSRPLSLYLSLFLSLSLPPSLSGWKEDAGLQSLD